MGLGATLITMLMHQNGGR